MGGRLDLRAWHLRLAGRRAARLRVRSTRHERDGLDAPAPRAYRDRRRGMGQSAVAARAADTHALAGADRTSRVPGALARCDSAWTLAHLAHSFAPHRAALPLRLALPASSACPLPGKKSPAS